MGMEMSQEEVFAFVGRLVMESHQLRKQLMEHKCQPCERQHADDPLVGEVVENE